MAKYRTKVEYVDAEQFLPPEQVPVGVKCFKVAFSDEVRGSLVTGHGTYVLYSGDWLVTDKNGEKWPYSDEEFTRDYEPAVTD